jgi:hypothetical protein
MPEGELEKLRQRKKELMLESDINRQILRVEVAQLQIKAVEWRRNLLKARTAYQWVAPAAGMFFAIYGMKKKLTTHAAKAPHNGHGRRKSAYLNLLAPLAMAALKRGYGIWRHSKNGKRRGAD